ncbi:unnamed protein product [Brachionus calyciflorus]|uniref:Uncharacterized protein n=1 Tax=Brachionus calyciflorus TaxID=104777 RepID=A0A814D6Y5_9BILA|nr:unnamed protein product [Brachionus calyciflorus]
MNTRSRPRTSATSQHEDSDNDINKRVQKHRRLREAREESITNLDRAIVEQTSLPQTSIQNSSSNETTNTVRIAHNSQNFNSIPVSNSLRNISFVGSDSLRILNEMLKYAKDDFFPKKKFNNNGKEFEYTSYLHFTESILSTNSPDQKVEYKCVFCKVKLVA